MPCPIGPEIVSKACPASSPVCPLKPWPRRAVYRVVGRAWTCSPGGSDTGTHRAEGGKEVSCRPGASSPAQVWASEPAFQVILNVYLSSSEEEHTVILVMVHSMAANLNSRYGTIALRGNTGLGSWKPLVTTSVN